MAPSSRRTKKVSQAKVAKSKKATPRVGLHDLLSQRPLPKPKTYEELCDETSIPRRRGRRSTLRRDDILSISEAAEEQGEALKDYADDFAADSIVHLTWGRLESGPVKAIVKPRRHAGMSRLRKVKNQGTSLVRNQASEPKHSMLLSLPREIREIIYGYLLTHPTPILIHCDWYAIQGNSPLDHAILRVCWQITLEASCFIYQHNVFHALVRDSNPSWRYGIENKYVPFFRNVVIECLLENWRAKWVEKTALCILTLVKSDTVLDSLTLKISPQKVGMTDMLLGREANPTTFADFFWAKSNVMKALVRLQCKVFNLVLKLPGREERVLISVDVRFLECNYVKSLFTEDEIAKETRLQRAEEVKKTLEGLKEKVEKVAENWEDAVRQGIGRLMGEDEELGDGMRLMKV